MKQFTRVLFVDTDNTCGSIMAEAVMRSVCRDHPMEVLSRGLIVLMPEPLNPKAVAVMTGNQLKAAKTASEELTGEDIGRDTLVLTLTAREKAQVLERFPKAGNVYTLGEFTGRSADIEVPHGGTLADYGACCEYIDLLVKLAAESLFRESD